MKARRLEITATALLAAGLFLFLGTEPAHAAVTLNKGFSDMPAQYIVFDKLDVSKATLSSANSAVSMKTTSNYNGRKAVVWSVTASGEKSLSNPFKVTFPNAGFDCDGNRVDLVLACTSCKAQLYSGQTAAARDQVLLISELAANDPDWNSYIQFTSLPDKGASAIYGIQMTFDVRVYKTGTTTSCSYPLLMNVSDLDWYDETSSSASWSGTYAESITLNSGCGSNAYIAQDSLLGHNSANTRFYGSAVDDSTERSTVAFTLNASGGRITWAGSNCATKLFSSKTFEITASSGTGGNISPKGTSTVGWRTAKSYTATASTGYKVYRVTVDGARVSGTGGKTLKYDFEDIRKDHTISASFTPISYEVEFDGNGASAGSTDPLKGCKYNTSYTMPECGFTRSTHSFVSWNTKADGSGKSYLPGSAFKNLSSTDGGKAVLYAQWADLAVERTVTVRIPEDDFARAQAGSGSPLMVVARYYDEAAGIGWTIPIDLSDCTIEDGFATIRTQAKATENASCTLLDSAVFQLSSREDRGLETIFTLALPEFSLTSSSDFVVNHFPAEAESAQKASTSDEPREPSETAPTILKAQDEEDAASTESAPQEAPDDNMEAPSSTEAETSESAAPGSESDIDGQAEKAQRETEALLATGPEVNCTIPGETESITIGKPGFEPENAIDLSSSQDRSILGAYDASEKRFYIYSTQDLPIVANQDCSGIFEGLEHLERIDVSDLDMRQAESLARAFQGCAALEELDLSEWGTDSLENAEDMLQGCEGLLRMSFGKGWKQPKSDRYRATFPMDMADGETVFPAGQAIPPESGNYDADLAQGTADSAEADRSASRPNDAWEGSFSAAADQQEATGTNLAPTAKPSLENQDETQDPTTPTGNDAMQNEGDAAGAGMGKAG
ncbi:MAG: hypothetical protein ACI4B9_05865 [Eggerthellaceae bacterium]